MVSRASGCVTGCRAAGERAIRDPVRRVRSPVKSSGPGGVASRYGSELGLDAVQQAGGRHPVDDDGALLLDDLGHRRGGGVGGKMFDGHKCSTSFVVALEKA